MPRALAVVTAALLAVTVTSGTTAQSIDGTIAAVASPAGPSSAQPQLTVSARGVLLSWIERTGDVAALKFSEWKGGAWTAPRTVSSGRDWFVNWADVPSVIRLADGSLYGHWLQKSGPDTYAYDVRLARSTDDGQTWTPSFTPHDDATKTEHGFASLFQMPGAGLGLIWLDGRAMKPGHGEPGGEMSVRGAIYDQKGKQISEAAVDLRVCECCPTTAAVTADGPIVAYRDRSPAEIRDIYVARFVAGKWTEPVPVHRDNWQIAACPVNGPALSAIGKTVALAWFTAKGDEGHTYVAFSSDSGKSFGTPVRLDDVSALGRVDVALLDDGSAAATWIEFAGGKAQFKMRRVTAAGERSSAVTVSGLAASRASGYPRMARAGNELMFAWTESGTPSRVSTARLSLTKLQTSLQR
ncbi:MAG: glycoside hydrolase [Cyanobacteria bacterium]|nr:glycoside hydrolase [Cyanobacteriota bacterium]